MQTRALTCYRRCDAVTLQYQQHSSSFRFHRSNVSYQNKVHWLVTRFAASVYCVEMGSSVEAERRFPYQGIPGRKMHPVLTTCQSFLTN